MSVARAREMYEAGMLGPTPAPPALLAELAVGSPEERAWALAVRAQRWAADPRMATPPTRAEIEALGARPELWRSVIEHARGRLCAADSVDLETWVDLFPAGDPVGEAWRDAFVAWLRIARGESVDDTALDALAKRARSLGRAALAVEVTALKAMCALQHGTLADARTLARRASRMARTEGVPQAEYLASVVLARMRRMSGYPHLAERILGALARFASPRWRPWIAWERAMAGVVPEAADGAAGALVRALHAARAGEIATFEEASADVHAEVAGFAPFADEADLLLAACDPEAERVPEALVPWARGEADATPRGVAGTSDPSGVRAYVYGRPEASGRRILPTGVALAETYGAEVLVRTQRKQARIEMLVAALTIAGAEGIETGRCFAQVYGFEYVDEMHRGTFDVLLHRARAYLGERGELHRDATHVRLQLARPIAVPDARCAELVEERVLRALAQAGDAASAKAAASEAGLSLRQVQSALQSLVDEGVCEVRKEGRRVFYDVKDTTFLEPTRHR